MLYTLSEPRSVAKLLCLFCLPGLCNFQRGTEQRSNHLTFNIVTGQYEKQCEQRGGSGRASTNGRKSKLESRNSKPGIAKVISIRTTYHVTRHISYAGRWAYERALSLIGLEQVEQVEQAEQAEQAEQHGSVLRLFSLLI